jgi:hypothetical protein
MSITYLNNSPASDAQRQYLRALLGTRDAPVEVARLAYLAEHDPGRLTVSQASELIDALRKKKSSAQIAEERRQDECERLRAYMWGTLGGEVAGEDVVADRWDDALNPHFVIQREVWGTHWTGQRLRIDRVLWPRFSWSDGTDTPIGFEIKTRAGSKKGPRQAADYAATKWDLMPPHPVWANSVPDNGTLLIGLHCNHRDESRALETFGGFGFVYEPVNRYQVVDDHGTEEVGIHSTGDLRLYYNGALMWSHHSGVRPTRWGARRKIGSH